MLQPVFIEKLKRPKGRGFWGAYETARDTWGHWLFTPRGSLYQGGTGVGAVYCNVGSPTGPGIPVIHLIVPDAWWIATFWEPDEAEWSVTFDVCTRPRFTGGCWSYVDLELDVLVAASTSNVRVDDDDEFKAACRAGWISTEEAECAHSAVDQARALVGPASGFLKAGRTRLRSAQAIGLRPVQDLR